MKLSRIARGWLIAYSECRHSGDIPSALHQLEAPRRAGDLLAEVEFALLGRDAGLTHDEVGAIVDRVHECAPGEDSDLHFALYRAYERLLGLCEPEQMYVRAFDHLVLAATHSDNPMDAFAVALNFENGRVAVAKDYAKALEWYRCAECRGHPDAAGAIQRLQRKRLKPI